MRPMRIMLAALLTAVVAISLSVCAYAAIVVPDITRTDGTISLNVVDTSGNAVRGGAFTLYHVADAQKINANHYFSFTAEFASCPINLEYYCQKVIVDGVETSARTIRTDTDLVEKLVSFVNDNSITGTTVSVDSSGFAQFQNLSMGLYLLVQTTPAPHYSAVNPFVITVPLWDEASDSWVYQVNAAPKMDSPTYKPPGGGKEDPPTPPTPPDPPGEEVPPSPPDTPKLPQTGQLWWPVWILAAGGLVLFSAGWHERRKEDHGETH